jgi:protein gp37
VAKTSIEWTDHSINPLRASVGGESDGHYCEKVSPGCKNCYSSRLQPRFRMPAFQEQRGLGVTHSLDTGKLRQVLDRRTPTKWFWCDMTDMFGDWVPIHHIARCFAAMASTPHHTHQVLTKRPGRMLEVTTRLYANDCSMLIEAGEQLAADIGACHLNEDTWQAPPRNVWLGTSVEDQVRAEQRVPDLLACPAATHFLSCEPLLGPVDISRWLTRSTLLHCCMDVAGAIRNRSFDGLQKEGRSLNRREAEDELLRILATGVRVLPMSDDCDAFDDQKGCPGHASPAIDWVITGSESGHGARPMDEEWVRSLRDQCSASGARFFYKQKLEGKKKVGLPLLDGRQWAEFPEARGA